MKIGIISPYMKKYGGFFCLMVYWIKGWNVDWGYSATKSIDGEVPSELLR